MDTEKTNAWTFDGHKISTMRDMMREATSAWKNKKSESFLKAYVGHLCESTKKNSSDSLGIAMANIKSMARYYASNGPEMKAMRSYVSIEDKIREQLR
jgi:hypothetical protein